MKQARREPSKWLSFRKNHWASPAIGSSGQVALEYILLLVIVTSLGAFIIRGFVSRKPDEPGFLVKKWERILQAIAEDDPEVDRNR
jgi:hypothetical protein